MDITKELEENQTILLLVPGEEYNNVIKDITKDLSKKSLCYVTLNKTSDALKDTFKKGNIETENIIFIDAISKTIKGITGEIDDCYFVSSPGALTEMSLVISKFLSHNFDYLIFDSITNLAIYERKEPIGKFISHVINNIRVGGTKAVFLALKVKEQEALMQETEMFVDKVIDLKKAGDDE